MTPKPMALRNKRRVKKSSNRYLKPGALAKLRYNLSTSRCCTDIGKKRVVLDSKDKKNIGKQRIMLDTEERKMDSLLRDDIGNQSTTPDTSSTTINFWSPLRPHHVIRQVKFLESPRTPAAIDLECHSRLESLPIELLVKILCYLHHDQLRAVFHVSQRIRSAVIIARQTYFNYTTPDRSRLEMLRIQTPLPTESWPFTRGVGKGIRISSPLTPKAPRQPPRPPRLHLLDIKQVAAVLFQDSTLPSSCMLLPNFPKPKLLKPLASNRVLFYEDELCKAVAQNKLR
ncbi:F-box protein At4g35930-like [Phalaenopsis equestris]|uniref:F-box protein At4g35930-like n=1 Tax=Phalaenopsis equestris TaxID=78828 RepID=UPI0009E24D05|nr:F-box protein At4g35930-like [Phalaenopsis equestris]XP_020592197.1 F-box protein At4g35930-like [Phalaenopsis equestris]